MKLSIKWVLIFTFIGMIWGLQIIINLFSYVLTEKVLTEHARQIMHIVSATANGKSRDYLSIAQASANLTKRLLHSHIIDQNRQEDLEKYFYSQLQTNPQFAGIYFAQPNGDFFYVSHNNEHALNGFRTKIIKTSNQNRIVDLIFRDQEFNFQFSRKDPGDQYDPRTRPWYKRAVANKKSIWTDPYIFYTSQKPGITTASPVYRKDGSLDGVVGVDIEIDKLSKFLAMHRVGKNGRAFIINQNADVVAHQDGISVKIKIRDINDSMRLVKITELGDAVARKAFESLTNHHNAAPNLKLTQPIFVRFSHDGVKYDAEFEPFLSGTLPWIICIYMPENDYMGEIRHNMTVIYWLTLVILLTGTLLCLLIARMISRPIANLEEDAQAVKRQNFTQQSDTDSFIAEIDSLSHSFSDMKLALQLYKEENEQLHAHLKQSHLETIYRLASASEFKDKNTADHIQRISAYAVAVAEKLGLGEDEVEIIKYASPMHDIGKIGIPDAILTKKGGLSPTERRVMEQHTSIGGKILSPQDSALLKASIEIAINHHEKWDGSGYPQGRRGTEIPVMARIVSLVDVFDALVSERSYKEDYPFDKAVAMIQEMRGTHFDPVVVDAFMSIIDNIRLIYEQNKSEI